MIAPVMSVDATIVVRRAVADDAAVLLGLIDALADYEKLTPPDEAAKSRLTRDIFGGKPRLEAFLAEVDGTAAGYTLIFETYSSFLALPTLYLEDFFVLPAFRGRKVGASLFQAMVAEARTRGCGRMEWSVLDWNQLAIDFYERFGAKHLKEWKYYRLDCGFASR
ncbi:MAG: GNAT family N-acetyltransferase [Acidobacteriota bacterium]|nr:GNAT family N-acetyltransferase [Acidobacteriota bacterium]